MTNQTNIANAIAPEYKRCGGVLYDHALANDLLVGWVLSGCPDSVKPAMLIAFECVSDFIHDMQELGTDLLDDCWTEYVADDALFYYHGAFGNHMPEQGEIEEWKEAHAKALDMFKARISNLSEILNQEEAA